MAYIAKADGTRQELIAVPTLEEAQAIVGGYVEAVYPRKTPSNVLLVDEEGHCKEKPLNEHGSELYGGAIVGDIVVMTREEAMRGRRWL